MGLINQNEQQYYDTSNNHGNYQFISLDTIIDQFLISYVGENKIIPRVKTQEVAFHAQRAMQELSFDTFKSCKAQEITVPATLQMVLPQDYVNYTKVSWVDGSGIKHPIYPTSRISNVKNIPKVSNDGEYAINATATATAGSEIIDLDKIYTDIHVAMKVRFNGLSGHYKIRNITHTSSITQITVFDTTGTLYTPTVSSIRAAQIKRRNYDLHQDVTSFTVSGFSHTLADDFVTTSQDISNVEVGMRFSGPLDLGENNDFFIVSNVDTTNGKVYANGLISSVQPTSLLPASFILNFSSRETESESWNNYKSSTSLENNDNYKDNDYWLINNKRYGLDPQHAQANGSFFIDCDLGKIHFSSNINGKTVILDYISDSLGTEKEMKVHKFAEEAMYKWIAHGILATTMNMPEHIVARFKKERFAETRKAKLRLSNIKLEEITQILRGKSKQIKH
tara:strand:- start:10563 stop:11915 length:1353 start_codon:yes stop_codon:yes gene_type:complete